MYTKSLNAFLSSTILSQEWLFTKYQSWKSAIAYSESFMANSRSEKTVLKSQEVKNERWSEIFF